MFSLKLRGTHEKDVINASNRMVQVNTIWVLLVQHSNIAEI